MKSRTYLVLDIDPILQGEAGRIVPPLPQSRSPCVPLIHNPAQPTQPGTVSSVDVPPGPRAASSTESRPLPQSQPQPRPRPVPVRSATPRVQRSATPAQPLQMSDVIPQFDAMRAAAREFVHQHIELDISEAHPTQRQQDESQQPPPTYPLPGYPMPSPPPLPLLAPPAKTAPNKSRAPGAEDPQEGPSETRASKRLAKANGTGTKADGAAPTRGGKAERGTRGGRGRGHGRRRGRGRKNQVEETE